GGCSAYTPSLAFQKPLVPTICKRRAVPDISMDADPNSGVLVQISLQGGYWRVGVRVELDGWFRFRHGAWSASGQQFGAVSGGVAVTGCEKEEDFKDETTFTYFRCLPQCR